MPHEPTDPAAALFRSLRVGSRRPLVEQWPRCSIQWPVHPLNLEQHVPSALEPTAPGALAESAWAEEYGGFVGGAAPTRLHVRLSGVPTWPASQHARWRADERSSDCRSTYSRPEERSRCVSSISTFRLLSPKKSLRKWRYGGHTNSSP